MAGGNKKAAVQEVAAKEVAAKEAATKEAAIKEAAMKDIAAKEAAAKETAAKEIAAKEAASKKEAAAKEIAAKEAASKEKAAKETAAKAGAKEGDCNGFVTPKVVEKVFELPLVTDTYDALAKLSTPLQPYVEKAGSIASPVVDCAFTVKDDIEAKMPEVVQSGLGKTKEQVLIHEI